MKIGISGQKMLVLLLSGLALGFSRSPNRSLRILREMKREWSLIERRELYRAIRRLYESKLVSLKENKDGTLSCVITRDGKKSALKYTVAEMTIPKPAYWDRKWRVIIFDIPEQKKYLRDTLRKKLKELELIELQKSVFVHPYECRNEIDFVIELYNARPYVRFIEATHIDNELHLMKKFRLL